MVVSFVDIGRTERWLLSFVDIGRTERWLLVLLILVELRGGC